MIRFLIDWAEFWPLLIPLPFTFTKNLSPYLRPIRIYIWLTLIINLASTLLWKFKSPWGLEPGDFLWNNNFLYNIGSIVRLLLFAWFFNRLRQRFMHRVKAIIPFVFIAFVIVNFSISENFIPSGYESFSSRLLATESALLLFYCLQYFIYLMIEERELPLKKIPGFWIVTGLSIYVAASFFIYLFYTYIVNQNLRLFAIDIWDVHNIVFIQLCIFIAVQFYQENKIKRQE